MFKSFYTVLLGACLISLSACKKTYNDPGEYEPKVTNPATSNEIPPGAGDGVTFANSGKSAIFNLYAPGKSTVYVIGDFNNWTVSDAYKLKNTADGSRWWLQVDNLDATKEYAYQYYVDNRIRIADPYTEKVLDPDNDRYIDATTYPSLMAYPAGKTTGIVSVMQATPAAYTWRNASFTRPDRNKLVIYELHIRDFIAAHNYQTLKDTLGYLAGLGINAIELMPVNEFEGNLSWGYNPSFYFAADKYYGTKNALKAFIDECHSRGIAVIQDMVLNHSFGQSPMVQLYWNSATGKPDASSPWFNADATHPYNVGYDFNHEKAATKTFVKNVCKFWMQEYKMDGFRFDLSKGFTQTKSTDDAGFAAKDDGRIATLKDYNSYIKGIDPGFYVILEHFAVDAEEKVLTDDGMMTWNNVNYNAAQAAMGYNSGWDLSRLFYDKHSFTKTDGLVGYMESHDEERMQYRNISFGNSAGSYNVKDPATALKRDAMAAAFLLTSPGPKMIWQFGELGYDVNIDYNGRTGEKPIRWNYLADANRKALRDVYAKLIRMKIKNNIFNTTDITYNLGGAVKTILLKGTGTDATRVQVVGNFDVVNQTASISFPATGAWTDNLTGTTINVTATPFSMTLAPGEYHVYSNVTLAQ